MVPCECYYTQTRLRPAWPQSIVTIWMCAAVVLVTAWVSLVCFHTHRSLGPCVTRIFRKLASSRGAPDGWGRAKQDNEQQQHRWMMMRGIRAKRIYAFAHGWALIYPLIVMASIPQLWEMRKEPQAYTAFLEEHFWFEGMLCAAYGFFARCRKQSKNLEAVLLHMVLTTFFCWRLLTFSQEHDFHHGVFVMALTRLTFGVITNPKVTAALNTCLLACEAFVVIYNGIWGIHRAVVVYLFICLFSWAQERSFESEVEAKLAAEMAKEGRARVHDILSHVCDAVLELDETFTITSESPNFGAIVLQGRSCHGRCFIDFIFNEDRPSIVQFLRSNSEGSVSSCSARLVILSSNMVNVTIWHCFSARRHLIGVQEDQQDFSCAPLPPLRGEPWQRNHAKRTKSRQRSNHEQSTTVSQTFSPDALNLKPDAIVVKVLSEDDQLPIIELTVGAQLLLGPCAGIGSPLVRFVSQRDTLNRWIQEVMNHYLAGNLDEVAQVNHATVTLHAHTSRTPVPFTCSITWNESEADDDTMPVSLIFSPLTESNSSSSISSSSSSSADLPAGSSTRRGHGGTRRDQRTDSKQPCSGSLAHGASATCRQAECL